MRKHFIPHFALIADAATIHVQTGNIGYDIWPGEDGVDVIHQLSEGGVLFIARLRQTDFEICTHMTWITPKHNDAVGKQNGLFNIVGNDEDGLCRNGLLLPELEEFAAQVLCRENVEGRKRLVHKEDFGLDNEGTGKAYALAHSTGELFGVGGLETIESDSIQNFEAAVFALFWFYPAGLERGLYIFKNGKPGKKGKTLKDNGDVDLHRSDGLFMPENLTG